MFMSKLKTFFKACGVVTTLIYIVFAAPYVWNEIRAEIKHLKHEDNEDDFDNVKIY